MNDFLPVLFLGAGGYMLWRAKSLSSQGVVVKVRVVKQKIDWGKNTTASPIFEIIEGEYKGRTAKSEVGTSLGVHRKGSVLSGFYHPETGAIESQTTLAILEFISWMLIVGASGFLLWRYVISQFVS